MHPEEKKPAVEVAFTMLHAGGKFSRSGDGVYHISGGLHGVGVAVSNALSKRCEVTVFKDGQKHTIAFEGGELKQKLRSEKMKEKRTGTVVRLWPDPKYFDSPNIPINELEHLVRSKAYLLPGLTMVLEIEGKQNKVWKYERGMAQYFEFMLQGRELVAPLFSGEKHFDEKSVKDMTDIEPGEGAAWAIGWVADGDIFADSHVNLIPTRSGGTHEAGFRSGIFDALAAFMATRQLSPKGVKLIADDLWQRACFTDVDAAAAVVVRVQRDEVRSRRVGRNGDAVEQMTERRDVGRREAVAVVVHEEPALRIAQRQVLDRHAIGIVELDQRARAIAGNRGEQLGD